MFGGIKLNCRKKSRLINVLKVEIYDPCKISNLVEANNFN